MLNIFYFDPFTQQHIFCNFNSNQLHFLCAKQLHETNLAAKVLQLKNRFYFIFIYCIYYACVCMSR